MVESLEESHGYADASKPTYNRPNRRETSLENVWNKVIWSDETKIELNGHNHKCYIWSGFNKAYDENYTIPNTEVDSDIFREV